MPSTSGWQSKSPASTPAPRQGRPLDLANSALHAPRAGFGDTEFYPDLFDKSAVLVCRLAWNHPLPDGNKRAAWAALVLFIDLNDGLWDPDPLPVVSPDGRWALAALGHDLDENRQPASSSLVRVDLLSGEVEPIAEPTAPGPLVATWSRDGRWIVTIRSRDLLVIDAQDTTVTVPIPNVLPAHSTLLAAG